MTIFGGIWPFNLVQSWFEKLWNWVSTAAVNAVSVVSGWIWGAIYWVRDRISEGWNWLATGIHGAFDWLYARVQEGWSFLSGQVGNFVNWLWTSISRSFEWIANGLKASFDWLYARISEGWNWLSSNVGGAFNALYTFLSNGWNWLSSTVSQGLGGLWTAISTGLSNVGSAVWKAIGGLWDSLAGLADDITKSIGATLQLAFQALLAWFANQVATLAGYLVDSMKAAMATLNEALRPVVIGFIDSLKSAFKTGSPDKDLAEAVGDMVKTTQDRVVEELKKSYKSSFDPTTVIVTAGAISGLVLAAQVGVHTLASAAGISVMGTRLDLTDVVESAVDTMGLNRVVASSFALPIEIGLLLPLRYAYNQMFTPLIPGPMDLIRFVVREVITPTEFYETMPFHGYSKRWATAYWDAHWVLPGFSQLVDAYHRGVITDSDLEKFIVWHDYSPEPRPGTTKSDLDIMRGILKTQIPRVDLRYAWELGRLTDDELVEWYRKLGYEEDSELMAEIQMARALVEEVNKVRDQWLTDFIGGFTDEDTLRANLAEINISPARIDYYVSYAKQRREREAKKAWLGIYEDGYQKDLVTDEELEKRAREILVDEDAIELFLEKAYISKYKKPKVTAAG